MSGDESALRETIEGWRGLKSLRAQAIDLDKVTLIRDLQGSQLRQVADITALIERLGLNDEELEEYPSELRRCCGQGLRIWQYPSQFAPYLIDVGTLGIESYLEVGVRHGGTFVATVEYLRRFAGLKRAVGIDVLPCPSLVDYARMNPAARFVRVNTQGDEYARLLDSLGELGLVFIDSFHEEKQRRRELERVIDRARAIAVHDIAHDQLPGLRKVWNELQGMGTFECREYVDQYPSVGRSCMGIGLAIRRA